MTLEQTRPTISSIPLLRPSNDAPNPSILIISPVKDEGLYLQRTVESITRQDHPVAKWIIVNDGSSDDTGLIADRAAEVHPWIHVLHRPVGTQRRVGPGVIEAFYAGLELADLKSFDFVCKLDGDLEFGPRYFANLMSRFADDPQLGTASGKAYIPVNGSWVYERTGDQFSHGVAKLYRRDCFCQIGGFIRQVMWDGIDCHRCRMMNWKAESYPDPELAIKHLRQMGSSHRSVFHGRRRWGQGQYFMGTHPLYMAGITGYRMMERPWVLGGLNILLGYCQSRIRGDEQYADPEFRRHLRKWQMQELRDRVFGSDR